MELSELIASINSFVGGDKAKAKEVAKALRDNAKDVSQLLINVGAGQKSGEVGGKVTALEKERDEWKAKAEEVEQEFTEFKAKTPDVATVEARERAKWEPKVKAKDEEVKATKETLRKALGGGTMQKVVAHLVAKLGVDDDYAREVLAARYADRIAVGDDGRIGVLQVGETSEYDAVTEDEKVAALAADIRKTVPPKFVNTNADSGAGVRGGSGGGTGLKTVEQIRKEKQQDSAFAGF